MMKTSASCADAMRCERTTRTCALACSATLSRRTSPSLVAQAIEFGCRHGGYGHPVDVYALADVPETETLFGGSAHAFMLLAASAAWFDRKPYSSCECMIALGTEVISAADMARMVNRAIVAGADQLVFHGMPYPLLRDDGAAWFPFSPTRALGGVSMSCDLSRVPSASLVRLTALATQLASLMRVGRPHIDVLWLADAARFEDAPVWARKQLSPHPHESRAARELRRRGLAYAICSPQWIRRARIDGAGNMSIGHVASNVLIVDDGLLRPSLRARLERQGVRVVATATPAEWPRSGRLGPNADVLVRARRLAPGRWRFMCLNDADSSVSFGVDRTSRRVRPVYLNDASLDTTTNACTIGARGYAVLDVDDRKVTLC